MKWPVIAAIVASFLSPAYAQVRPAAPAPSGPTAADLFDSNTLQDIQLTMSSRDLAEMRARYTENLYFPADFLWRNVRVRNVAVRIRGLATRSATKPGLRVDFNRYIEKQTFLGLHSVVLDNELNDTTFVREAVSMAFIAKMGGPASRESFARLFINGEYQGVYGIVEAVDKEYLARTLGENDGYLFDHHYQNGFHAEDLGDDLEQYKWRFEAQTHRLEPDSILYSPIRDLFREVNHDMDGAWRSRVSEYIDLPQFVTYVAIEHFLAELDGFTGYAGMANFYLYRPNGSTTHRVLPWDRDTTFQNIEHPIFDRVQENVLVSRALMFADLRDLYLNTLEKAAYAAADGRWLDGEMRRLAAVVKDAGYADTRKIFTNEEYETGMVFLLDFAKWRPKFVLEEVAKARKCGRGC